MHQFTNTLKIIKYFSTPLSSENSTNCNLLIINKKATHEIPLHCYGTYCDEHC